MDNLMQFWTGVGLGALSAYTSTKIGSLANRGAEGYVAAGIGGSVIAKIAQGSSLPARLINGTLYPPYEPQYATGYVVGALIGGLIYGIDRLQLESYVSNHIKDFGGNIRNKINNYKGVLQERLVEKYFRPRLF